MVVTAAANYAGFVFYMKHLVVEHILGKIFGHARAVERLADNNGIVDRVVVAKHALGPPQAPGEDRLAELVVEIFFVQALKDLLQIVDATVSRRASYVSRVRRRMAAVAMAAAV